MPHDIYRRETGFKALPGEKLPAQNKRLQEVWNRLTPYQQKPFIEKANAAKAGDNDFFTKEKYMNLKQDLTDLISEANSKLIPGYTEVVEAPKVSLL